MLNALWAFMMLTGLGWAAVHGTLDGNFGDRTAGGAD